MADDSVKVAIRVRPFVSNEKLAGAVNVLEYLTPTQLQIGGTHTFSYDHLYPDTTKQAEVYETCVAPLVQSFFEGYNATILAYGQTGSGKTHTMGTSSSAHLSPEEYGIIPRVIHELFDLMKSRESSHIFLVNVSFLEIYNDELIDLLCTIPRGRPDRPVPHIKEGRGDKIEVENIVKCEVKSVEETMDALERGSMNRAVGSTNMNAASSRSHAIFTLQLSQKVLAKDDDLGVSNDEIITSKFHFVDLAGSERLKRTGAVGDRMKEGININQGLLALGNVISALGDPSRKGSHVPFRDSRITRLLQDSLGGNSKTLMIAAVSPADTNKEETLNTLQYANRAKNIKCKARVNRDPISQKMDILRGRIKELEAELSVYRAGNVPTLEQRAQFAAMREAIASGTASTAGHGMSTVSNMNGNSIQSSPTRGAQFTGSSSYSTPIPAAAVPSVHHELPQQLKLDADQIAVNVHEWVLKQEQLATFETEVNRLQSRNKDLRAQLHAQAELAADFRMRRDGYRLKIESLMQRFPEVRRVLEAEKMEVEKEIAEKKRQQAEREEKQKQKQAQATTSEEEKHQVDEAPETATLMAAATNAASQLDESKQAEDGEEELSGKIWQTPLTVDPSAESVSSAGGSEVSTPAFHAEPSPDMSDVEGDGSDFIDIGMSPPASSAPSASPPSVATISASPLSSPSEQLVSPPSAASASPAAPAPSPSSSISDINNSSNTHSLPWYWESDDASLLFTLAEPESQPGSNPSQLNNDLRVLEQKTQLITRLVKKVRKQKEELNLSNNVVNKLKKQLTKMERKQQQRKRRHNSVDFDGMGEEEQDESQDEEAEEEDAADDGEGISTSRSHKRSTSALDGAGPSPSPDSALGGDDIDLSDDGDSDEEEEEEDFESLHTLAVLKEREHAHNMRRLEDEDSSVAKEILVKEAFLQQLTAEKQRSQHQRQMYERAIADLERDYEAQMKRTAELEKLAASKPTSASNIHGGLSEAQSVELKSLREKLKHLSQELKGYRDKLKEMDRLKKQHAQDEQKIRQLSSEIAQAKKAKVEVARKMDEAASKYREWVETKENKLKLLQKTQRKSELALRALQMEFSNQAMQLKRAREANNLLSRKVRDQDSASQARQRAQAAAARSARSAASRSGGASSSHKSSSRTGAGEKSARSRKGGRTPHGLPTHSRTRSDALSTSQLNTPQALKALENEFVAFLTTECVRSYLSNRVVHYRHQVSKYQSEKGEAENLLAEVEESQYLQQELALKSLEAQVEDSQRVLAKVKAKLEQVEKDAANAASSLSEAAGVMKDSLEDRFAARFKSLISSESPKKLIGTMVRAVIDGFKPENIIEAINKELGLVYGNVNQSDVVGKVQMFSPPYAAPTKSSQGHARRGSSYGPSLSVATPVSASLSTSPLHSRRPSGSISVSVPSPASLPCARQRRQNSMPCSPTHKNAAGAGPSAPAGGSVSARTNSPLSLSPLQAHLNQPHGIDIGQASSTNAEGEDQLVPLRLIPPVSDESPMSPNSATRAFSVHHTLINMGGAAWNNGRVNAPSAVPLHNNYTSEETVPTGADGEEVEERKSRSSLTNSSSSSSSSTRYTGGGQVFARLTDPKNFTGVYRNVHQEVAARASSSSSMHNSAPSGSALLGQTIRSSGKLLGAMPTQQGGPASLLRKPSNVQTSSASSTSGLLPVRGGSHSDRSASPGWSGDNATPTPDSAAAAAAAAALQRMPIHERLANPQSFTGAQKQKFAEGVSRHKYPGSGSSSSSSSAPHHGHHRENTAFTFNRLHGSDRHSGNHGSHKHSGGVGDTASSQAGDEESSSLTETSPLVSSLANGPPVPPMSLSDSPVTSAGAPSASPDPSPSINVESSRASGRLLSDSPIASSRPLVAVDVNVDANGNEEEEVVDDHDHDHASSSNNSGVLENKENSPLQQQQGPIINADSRSSAIINGATLDKAPAKRSTRGGSIAGMAALSQVAPVDGVDGDADNVTSADIEA